MSASLPLTVRNTEPVPLRGIVPVEFPEFAEGLDSDLRRGARVAAFFGAPQHDRTQLHAILADGIAGRLRWWITTVGREYPSFTPNHPQLHWFERELAEQWAVVPAGHPWLKPIRFHRAWRVDADAWGRAREEVPLPSVTDFYRVRGEEIHEVAVGPVHAGVIEPGHFRFQCHGEQVLHLEVSLGYQHRGVERSVVGGPGLRTIHYMETLAGDTTIGHATAYSHAVEALSGIRTTGRDERLRAVALELERLANHIGDLGALANDVGYLPTASYCGRIRGDVLNMTAVLCGNRFGRRLVRPGGTGVEVSASQIREVAHRLATVSREAKGAVGLLWQTPSVRARLENTGRLSKEVCLDLGLVGVAARACGVARDVRKDLPSGAYLEAPFPVSTHDDGDVRSRALVRWMEVQTSVELLTRTLAALEVEDPGPSPPSCPAVQAAPETGVVSLVEGWRGEVCHVALTDSTGKFAVYKIVDPSFHNWAGLARVLRNQQISDFPLCNKSFNLSYCGHDL